jgi:hypothetical protein
MDNPSNSNKESEQVGKKTSNFYHNHSRNRNYRSGLSWHNNVLSRAKQHYSNAQSITYFLVCAIA